MMKENFFSSIIHAIKNIFSKKKKELPEKSEITNDIRMANIKQSNVSDFAEGFSTQKKEARIISIQKLYEQNQLDLAILTDEEVFALKELYEKQILELEKKYDTKARELEALEEAS